MARRERTGLWSSPAKAGAQTSDRPVGILCTAPCGAPADALRASALADGGTVFAVEDDGPGLAEAMRGRLFTPGATSKAAGSGLGLVIARAIVEQHGGTLAIENRPQGGCSAVCTLPRQHPARTSEVP